MLTLTEKKKNEIDACALTVTGTWPAPSALMLKPMCTEANVKPNARRLAPPSALIPKR